MRLTTKVLLALVILLATPAAFAQVSGDDPGVFSVEGISDGCGDTMNADECMASGSGWSTTICSDQACPACGFDMNMTKSVCYRLYGGFGYCKCQGGGVGRDKYGNKFPNCAASGSCASRR
jgi:hypothetical protein